LEPGQAKKTASPSVHDKAALKEILGRLEPGLSAHLENLGLEMVDVAIASAGGKLVARFTIDKAWAGNGRALAAEAGSLSGNGSNGESRGQERRSLVTIDDCAAVSRKISLLLDELDPEPGPGYVLEVSSPGLDRPLRGLADFERFQGCLVKLKLCQDGHVSRKTGRLELGPMRLVTGQGGAVPFSLDMVVSARLVPEI
jgi:ribosome maturation factor RimP